MTDPLVQKSTDNHTLEEWLLYYEDRLLSYAATREGILTATPARPEVITARGHKSSDATAAKGLALASLEDHEPWLVFIREFEQSLADSAPHLLVILRLRRQYRNHRGRRGWFGPVQARFPHEMAALTGNMPEDHWKDSRTTFQAYWREIVDLGVREALRRGLL